MENGYRGNRHPDGVRVKRAGSANGFVSVSLALPAGKRYLVFPSLSY
jgi:hypothetical protein